MEFNKTNWKRALEQAVRDPKVGIRIARLCGDEHFGLYVASVPDRVGCHVHFHGSETYEIVKGKGELHLGFVRGRDPDSIEWRQSEPVEAGDVFLIGPGFAHQLRNKGKADLVIIFGCPPSHLDNHLDRLMIESPPG
jgi:mannose-6-phosphate isomerase-like protein (cupin superfamily)